MTLLPATNADNATTVGTQIGEFAACQPKTTPYGDHSSIVVPDTAGTIVGRIPSAKFGSASISPSADASSRSAKLMVWPVSATDCATTIEPTAANASRH